MRSISRSLGTTSLACSSRITSTLHCRGPPSAATPSAVRASTGPRRRKSGFPLKPRQYHPFSALLAPSQRDLRRCPRHRRVGEFRMRNRLRRTLAIALAVTGVTAAAAPASVVERDRFEDEPYGFSYDCGFPVEVTGVASGHFRLREGSGDDATAFF